MEVRTCCKERECERVDGEVDVSMRPEVGPVPAVSALLDGPDLSAIGKKLSVGGEGSLSRWLSSNRRKMKSRQTRGVQSKSQYRTFSDRQGGFGFVYKGRLKDGKIAAIKVLSTESRQGVKEFLTEINVISEIQHENLVKLYGCC
ncbi:Protein kinase domain protein [Raphanus sativus]|nr:Protein kinase domain protein [Raphanus sativus]